LTHLSRKDTTIWRSCPVENAVPVANGKVATVRDGSYRICHLLSYHLMAKPVIIGSVLAWQQGATFHWGLFILALVGAIILLLIAVTVVLDVYRDTPNTLEGHGLLNNVNGIACPQRNLLCKKWLTH